MVDLKASLAGMEGRGFYNKHSTLQSAGIQNSLPLWKDAIDKATLSKDALTIVDYGSSQGHNSMEPISLAIEMVRQRIDISTPISVIHTDLPGNDFSSLFETIRGDQKSYMKLGGPIFPSAIGRSYFDQILPSNSVDLAWNSWTLQWMSRNPVEDPNFLYGAYSSSEEIRSAVSKQLAEDWRNFLSVRSEELKPGGVLFSLFGARSASTIGWEWMAKEFWEGIVDMCNAGLLSEEEKTRINLPIGPRYLNDIEAPFGEHRIYSGLRLEHAEVMQSPDPFWAEYQRTRDARKFGENWKNMMKAVSAPVIKDAISAGKDASAIVEDLFDRFARRLAQSPRETEHFVGVVILQRTGNQ